MMYPKARMDALTDGIYAVAMTLLVLEIRLPEHVSLNSNGDLTREVIGLWPKFYPYLLSFFVLGISWLSKARIKTRERFLGKRFAFVWLINLAVITCIPFTTMILGQHGALAVAVWLYAANMALNGITSLAMLLLTPDAKEEWTDANRSQSLSLICASVLAAAIAFWYPSYAPIAFALTALPALRRTRRSPPPEITSVEQA